MRESRRSRAQGRGGARRGGLRAPAPAVLGRREHRGQHGHRHHQAQHPGGQRPPAERVGGVLVPVGRVEQADRLAQRDGQQEAPGEERGAAGRAPVGDGESGGREERGGEGPLVGADQLGGGGGAGVEEPLDEVPEGAVPLDDAVDRPGGERGRVERQEERGGVVRAVVLGGGAGGGAARTDVQHVAVPHDHARSPFPCRSSPWRSRRRCRRCRRLTVSRTGPGAGEVPLRVSRVDQDPCGGHGTRCGRASIRSGRAAVTARGGR